MGGVYACNSIDSQKKYLNNLGIFWRNEKEFIVTLKTVGLRRILLIALPLQMHSKHELSLDEIIQIYEYDRRLRSLIFSGLEVLEISLQATIINNFNLSSLKSSKPIHKWSFGELVDFLSTMTGTSLRKIAQVYGVEEEKIFYQWIWSLVDVRNISAHHGIILNRKFSRIPALRTVKNYPFLKHFDEIYEINRAYPHFGLLSFLINDFKFGQEWSRDIKRHLLTYPRNLVDLRSSLGVPLGWELQQLWNPNGS